jgi:hypothetical protein
MDFMNLNPSAPSPSMFGGTGLLPGSPAAAPTSQAAQNQGGGFLDYLMRNRQTQAAPQQGAPMADPNAAASGQARQGLSGLMGALKF